jgi:NADH-quinone oxidoreductase subunit F
MDIQLKEKRIAQDDQEKKIAVIDRKMAKLNFREEGLIEVLICAQDTFGFLSKEILNYISKGLHIPLSRVYGVATFYDQFTFEPRGATSSMICTGPSCSIAGGAEVLEEVRVQTGVSASEKYSLDGRYHVHQVSCLGLCDQSPAAIVDGKTQVNLKPQDVEAMLKGEAEESHIQVCGEPREMTAHIGKLPPTNISAHLSAGAFGALEKALNSMTPEQVIDEVKESRLTGRGGAGFPTGSKWEFTRKAKGKDKYIVCNFDESEPGTFKDRVLMEGDPFRVIEGMTISAYAAGAENGYIFVRGEYMQATEILESALDELYGEGLLGEDILGHKLKFNVDIRHNAGAYICGEETALFEAVEGKRGNPRRKPPYPTQAGLFGAPTSINNVETFAIVPSLILHGGEWFRQWGTDLSSGLKLFCLSGHVNSPGVVEVPYGLTVRELVEQYGGGFNGIPQAVLIGGAAGGFLHPDNLDVPLTHEDLRELNVPIGSGAVIVFNESVDLWKVIEGLASFFVNECCGQCAPCRLGTRQIFHILQRINYGNFCSGDLHKAKGLGETIKTTCICGLGMTAANPLTTYLENFENIPVN